MAKTTQNKLIFLLEDHLELGRSLSQKLTESSYEPLWYQSIASAKESPHLSEVDLFILDVGLPDGNGFDFARWIKENQLNQPLIFLTAMSSAEDRLKGYELGAEEYIPKPFLYKELELRINHVLHNHAPQSFYEYKDLRVDFDALTISWTDGTIVFPQAKDLQILKLLISRSPKIVSRDEILDEVWGAEEFPSERTVDNSIVRLRQILGEYQVYLKSARGRGYQWVTKESV